MRRLDGITNAMDMNLGKLQDMVRDREVWRAAVHGIADTTGQINNNSLLRKSCPRESRRGKGLWEQRKRQALP